MTTHQIFGAIAVVLGALLLGFAYQSSTAPMEQLSETLTGRYTGSTMWALALGVCAIVGGGLFAVFGKRAA